MALRISGRKLSFDVLSSDGGSSLDDEVPLYRSNSDPVPENGAFSPLARKRKNKGSKRKKKTKMMIEHSIEDIDEDPITEKQVDAVFFDGPQQHQRLRSSSSFGDVEDACVNGLKATDYQSYSYQTNTTVIEEVSTKTTVGSECDGSVRTVHQVSEEPPNPKPEPEFQIVRGDRHAFVELRQRNVSGSGAGDELSMVVNGGDNNGSVNEESFGELCPPAVQPKAEPNGDYVKKKLQTAESLDWKQIMAEDSTDQTSLEKSPLKYFTGEIYSGNSLRGTTTLGTEKERERVYDTLFRLPWRCELLIDVGFFVCFDSFLSLLTIMPTRILMTFWRLLNTWQFQMPSAAELSDFSCLIALACGVSLLQQVDISLIYHMIRGQGTIKLYVVYNVLEIFDKLCQNFGGDVFQTLFGSAKGLASSSPENINFWLWRFMSDQALTIVASIVHSFVLLAQAITLATCIVAHNNALLALLVSNNFAEIKSNVFKRYSKENVHSLVYFATNITHALKEEEKNLTDSIERFHISAFILFVLAQNILEAEGSWFGSFLSNALLVFVCEMVIDVIKHSFIAKFNEIKPTAYSEFLEDLCKQTLNMQPEDGKKNLTFVPLAPACVVIRVLTPVYAAHLPSGPPLWRLLWVFILSGMTYLMLTSLKVMIGMGLQKHATWYVKRCQRRKHHLHYD